jgi:hypothetical protein
MGLPRLARLGFAGFVWVHLALQAYRAHDARAFPEPALESHPALVALGCLLWVPFLIVSLPELYHVRKRVLPDAARERTLAIVEPVAIAATVLFALVHAGQYALPLLTGAALPEDVRPELVAALSGTWLGFPLEALSYLLALGCASFCAVRQAARALPARPEVSRILVLLGVLGYVLGCYAVVRVASGTLWPP